MKRILGLFKKNKDKNQVSKEKEREILEQKVEQGTDFAVKQYRKVFEKLAEYDRK